MFGTAPFVRRSHGGKCTRKRCNSSSDWANDPLRGHHVPDSARLAVRGDRQIAIRTIVTFLRETIMTIFLIILVSVLLLALFVGVTVAGGRSHDRQNKRRDHDR